MRFPLVALAALALTACGDKVESIPRPPKDKLTEVPVPGRPAGKGAEYVDHNGVTRRAVTDEENADYLKALRSAVVTCNSKLNWLNIWFKTLTEN